jgi:hypothetical protein
VGGGGSVTVVTERVSVSCPNCGRPSGVIDGTYQMSEEITQYLGGPEVGPQMLRELQAVLGDVRSGASTPEQAAEAIQSDFPTLSKIVGLLRDPKWIGVILAVIALVLQIKDEVDPPSASLTPQQIEQIVRHVEEEQEDIPAPPPMVEQPFRAPVRVGRNEPCPCGSGQKYKRCCGAE